MLVEMEKFGGHINTPESPCALRGWYNVAIDWDDFWRCWNEAIAPVNADTIERYSTFKVYPYEMLEKAVEQYRKSKRYTLALAAAQKAVKDNEEAKKAEELRVRQDVPAITKMYDELLLKNKELENKAKAYASFTSNLASDISEMEKIVYDAKWAPKHFKNKAHFIKNKSIVEWNGKGLVCGNTQTGDRE
jgi:hypothetical protein